MRNTFLFLIVLVGSINSVTSQVTGQFTVNGDVTKYYVVTFKDVAWDTNVSTEFELGRSNVHLNGTWRGSLISAFKFHTTRWGSGADFISANINQSSNTSDFIGGWKDATTANNDDRIIVWLRGGTTTYYYKSNFAIQPMVYDGVQNPISFQETNGALHTFKTARDSYLNPNGSNINGNIFVNGTGINYLGGSVGIGTKTPVGALDVNGAIVANSISTMGKVGVGITNPTYAVEVNKSTSDRIQMKVAADGIQKASISVSAGREWTINALPGGSEVSSFSIKDESVGVERLRIDNNGNVGINTADTKGYKFGVNGAAIFTKVVVKNFATWADYVFEPTYQLRSLQSLEEFINNYKHLPDVASAADVAKDGNDINATQIAMLKKIEELTLYVIELNKKIEKLEVKK